MFNGDTIKLKRLQRVLVIAIPVYLSALSQMISADDASNRLNPALPRLGTVINPAQLAALPEHVFSDGQGLPAGQGSATQGRGLYAAQCAQCHGANGEGGRALELVGDRALLNTEYPDRGIAVYWPHAPTLFEYIYRSMPPDKPASLSADELYAVIAHLLVINDLWNEEDMLDGAALSQVAMPNVDGFRTIGR